MTTLIEHETDRLNPWLMIHPMTLEDSEAMTALRAVAGPMKGKLQGIGAREPFDAIARRTAAPEGVSYEADIVGGVSGWWCVPNQVRADEVVLHLHGGWFNWGTALSFRHLAGHIANRAGVAVFVPDYRLAPEHPFPAAVLDVKACFKGLAHRGYKRIAITGDSAGGCLALVLLSIVASESFEGITLVGVAALSPVTDLTFAGASWKTRLDVDPYFTQSQAEGLVNAYLGDANPLDPIASPLFADMTSFPPILLQVGENEVLYDDSRRYVELAVAAGVDAKLDVWEGMVHGFAGGVGHMHAATETLDAIGAFLTKQLSVETQPNDAT